MASGLPTWTTLLRELLAEFVRKTYALTGSIETETLIVELQARLENQSPLVYAQFIRAQFSSEDFQERLVHKILYNSGKRPEPGLICRAIARLGHHLNSVLTFNYDELIEDALSAEGFECTPIYEADAWSAISGIPVYHPHGYLPYELSPSKEYRIILAETDYHLQYHSPNLWSNIAISRVLLESVCLFVGTS